MGEMNPAMTRHIEREWRGEERLPQLIEAAEAVERLRDTPGWDALQRVIEREMVLIQTGLERGLSRGPDDYPRKLGRLGGLRAINEAAEAIVGIAQRRRTQAEARAAARAARNDDKEEEAA